jgi:hypothetical protein
MVRSSTVIYLRWKITGRVEAFINLGKLYTSYSSNDLGVSRWTLDRKDLFDGWENDFIEIKKVYLR